MLKNDALSANPLTYHVQVALATAAIERQDHALELVIQRRRLRHRIRTRGSDRLILPDRPTGHFLDAPFDPPPVQYVQERHAVDRGLMPLVPEASSGDTDYSNSKPGASC